MFGNAVNIEVSENPLLVALADEIARRFPELGQRSIPVSEMEITKDNLPTMPIAMSALTNLVFDQSVKSNKALVITENIQVEFWFKANKVKRSDNSETPFWSHYDYNPLVRKMVMLTKEWLSPRGEKLRLINMDLDSSSAAVMISFSLSHTYEFCEEEDEDFTVIGDIPFKAMPITCLPTCLED